MSSALSVAEAMCVQFSPTKMCASRDFQARNEIAARAELARLRDVVITNGNIFEELMQTVRVASLGQITQALFEVGAR